MIAFDRDGVLVGVLGDFAAGHPKNYTGATMPLIDSVINKVPPRSLIISNQAGIDRGYTTLAVVQSQFDWLLQIQPNFDGAFFCPSEGDTCWYHLREKPWAKAQGHSFRKPDRGMGVLAHRLLGHPMSCYVGDLSGDLSYADGRDSDRCFAQNLGCDYLDVNDFIRESRETRSR